VLDRIEQIITIYWPEEIAANDLASPVLGQQVRSARLALLDALHLNNLA
jgi:succinylarginine dihydrolase